jgi:uncharacterized protein YndB with AHSA1/START domain
MITVKTLVKAPLATVWNCWTRSEHITQWNFASDEWCCPSAINNLEPGGELNWRMEAKDGSMGFDLTGAYDEVVEQQSIAYHLSDGRKVSVVFVQDGDAVAVTESFEPEGQNPEDMQRAGWQAILDNFKKHAESV